MRKKWFALAMAVLAAPFFVTGGTTSSVEAQNPLVLTDLKAPRGLSTSGSFLLVAEQGTGRILQVTPQGTVGAIITGIPSTTAQSPEGPVTAGVTAAIEMGGTYYFTVGEAEQAGFDAVYSARPGARPVLLADLKAYERANNVDEGTDPTGKPDLVTNPYDLISDNQGGLLVSASGMNAVMRVSATGQISPYAIFKDRPNPLFPGIGGPTMDQVPTGIVRGPDGAAYVSTLTGFPFPQGAARVYRMQDTNNDGDAMDAGETTTYAEGLSTATNLAFDADGSLLVTEFSTNMLQQAPGRLVRVRGGQIVETVAAPLVSPTGLAVFDGQAIVSQEFPGIVAEAKTGASMIASARPPGGAPGGITPPSTGDGGLRDASTGVWMIYGGALLMAAVTVASARIAVRR